MTQVWVITCIWYSLSWATLKQLDHSSGLQLKLCFIDMVTYVASIYSTTSCSSINAALLFIAPWPVACIRYSNFYAILPLIVFDTLAVTCLGLLVSLPYLALWLQWCQACLFVFRLSSAHLQILQQLYCFAVFLYYSTYDMIPQRVKITGIVMYQTPKNS